MSQELAHGTDHDAHGPEQGKGIIGFIKRWVFTTNHKDIGTLYLWLAMFSFFLAGSMALVIRAELFQPGHRFVDPNFFNQMTTLAHYAVADAILRAFSDIRGHIQFTIHGFLRVIRQ